MLTLVGYHTRNGTVAVNEVSVTVTVTSPPEVCAVVNARSTHPLEVDAALAMASSEDTHAMLETADVPPPPSEHTVLPMVWQDVVGCATNQSAPSGTPSTEVLTASPEVPVRWFPWAVLGIRVVAIAAGATFLPKGRPFLAPLSFACHKALACYASHICVVHLIPDSGNFRIHVCKLLH